MSKKELDEALEERGEEIFEIIELAIDDIDLLTRAFEVIEQVCEELEGPELKIDIDIIPDKHLLN